MEKKNENFEKFINLYELSKTLRFELKPQTEQTKEILKQVIKDDSEKDKLYHETMKPLFDELHNKFIQESLRRVSFPIDILTKLEEKLLEIRNLQRNRKENQDKIKKLKKKISAIQTELRNVIVNEFNTVGLEWKKYWNKKKFINEKGKSKKIDFKMARKKNYNILTDAKILKILELQEEKKRNIKNLKAIKKFERFFMYFDGFNKNRENYYTIEEKHTRVAFRIVNENLVRFLENKNAFQEIEKVVSALSMHKDQFSLENFKNLLIQKDIDDFNKNIIGEINYQVNQHNQQQKTKLPKLKILYKQIGSKKNAPQIFEIKKGKEWKELQNLVKAQHSKKEINKETKKLLDSVKDFYKQFFASPESFALKEIFFNKQSINTVSSLWFINWKTLADLLRIEVNKKDEEQKIPTQISLAELKEELEKKENILEKNKDRKEESLLRSIFKLGKSGEYEKLFKENRWKTFLSIWKHEIDKNFKLIEEKERELETKSQEKFFKKKHGKFVKELCDAYLVIERMIKYHRVEEEIKTDSNFYNIFDAYIEEDILRDYYNAFRNYITKKPFSEEKIKLNFNCGYLLKNGWDKKYDAYGTTMFKRNGKYFLGIINGKGFSEKELENLKGNIDSENYAKKLVYISQKIDNKNPPRWFIRSKGDSFAPLVREKLLNPTPILEIYDKKLFTKDKNRIGYKKFLPQIIDYFKKGFKIHPDFKNFDFSNWKLSSEYETVADFYDHTASMCYRIDWEEINWETLLKLSEQKRISLFQIYNKDFGKTKEGSKKNLHTMLFLELLKPESAKHLKLLGGGEIFYRKASKDLPVREKNNKEMTFIDKRDGNKEKKVIQSRRYAEDKFFLHFPIAIKGKGINLKKEDVNVFLAEQKEKINIIGIDRGEKHFLYYSVIDSKNGNILEQGSFNKIKTQEEVDEKVLKVKYNNRHEMIHVELIPTGKKVKYVNYHLLLDYYEKKRMIARKNWEIIGKIKEMKEGYLSYVIHEIYQLILKYNAIVIMEDLNSEFKARRTAKVEKAVYKKFELALAKKLNHLILKDKKPNEKGGVLHAYQLTPKIEDGKNISRFEKAKQWGILFYVRANYTSITDPLTGWRKQKYISNSANIKDIKEFFYEDNMKIKYDPKKECFCFQYETGGKNWILYAHKNLERSWYNRQKKTVEFYNLYKKFEELFSGLDKSKNINQQINNEDNFKWKSLVFLWNLLNQIRNTDRKKEEDKNDFLQSPVWSEEIQDFFDSRKVDDYKRKLKKEFPKNGDANGAYNIARKGLILLKRIRKNPQDYDSLILDENWDKFAQKEK